MSFTSLGLHSLSLETTQMILFAMISPQKSAFPDTHIWNQCARSLLSALKQPFKSVNNELDAQPLTILIKLESGTGYSAMSWIINRAAQTTFMCNLSRPDLRSICLRLRFPPPHPSWHLFDALFFNLHPFLASFCPAFINSENPLKCLA